MESLIHHGLDGMGEVSTILMNEAMKLERAEFLGAVPYQRTASRVGHVPSRNGISNYRFDEEAAGQILDYLERAGKLAPAVG